MTEVTEASETGAEAPGSGRKKLLLAGVAALGVVAAGGAGAFYLFGIDGGNPSPALSEIREAYFLDLPVMTVNLNTDGGPVEFLRLTIALEVPDEAMLAIIEPRMPRVLDAFQVYLRELRRGDLEGSAGVYRLKEELQRRVNIAVYPAVVNDILFKEILVQ